MLGGPPGECLHPVEPGLGDVGLPAGQPAARRRGLAAPDLPGEQPVGERVVRQHPQAERPGRGDHLGLGLPFEQRPVILRGDERLRACLPGQVRGVGDLPAGEVGVPEVADLTLGDQFAQRVQGLADGRDRIGRVQLVQVEIVGAEPAQRLLDGPADVGPAALGARRGPPPLP